MEQQDAHVDKCLGSFGLKEYIWCTQVMSKKSYLRELTNVTTKSYLRVGTFSELGACQ